jgi:hypothetical protein
MSLGPRRGRSRALVISLAVCAAACGSTGTPSGPGTSPSPSPAAGPVSGAYTLQLRPSASCGFPVAAVSFPVDVVAADGTRPGLQGTLVGDRSAVEIELLSGAAVVRGGIGTRGDGALAQEGVQVWIHVIAEGSVTRAADGRGEIATGPTIGYVALGDPGGNEGDLGTCTATDHVFSLRAR